MFDFGEIEEEMVYEGLPEESSGARDIVLRRTRAEAGLVAADTRQARGESTALDPWWPPPQRYRALRPLEGRLVELHGAKTAVVREGDGETGTIVDASSCSQGRAHWDEAAGAYCVETFDGRILQVPAESLREYSPPAPELGGFDLAWPQGHDRAVIGSEGLSDRMELFSLRLAEAVQSKGYCLIQMFESDLLRKQASEAVNDINFAPDEKCIPPVLAEHYLGMCSESTLAVLPKKGLHDSLCRYDQRLGQLKETFLSMGSGCLDFEPCMRQRETLLRLPSTDWQSEGQKALDDADIEDHLDFLRRRKLCMIYVIRSHGGYIQLSPRKGCRGDSIRLPINMGRILVFRHDRMSYSYISESTDDLAIQSWILEEAHVLHLCSFDGRPEAMQDVLDLPKQSMSRKVIVSAASLRFPGDSLCTFGFQNALIGHVDGSYKVPIGRWDMDLYWSPERGGTGVMTGKSRAQHSGFISDDVLMNFDNEFFGMTAESAHVSVPGVRKTLETSYCALHQCGFTLESVKGQDIGNCTADGGNDWGQGMEFYGAEAAPNDWALQYAGPSGAPSACKISHWLGLAGPTFMVDTACSASLHAVTLQHSYLVTHETVGSALANGYNNALQPWAYIGLSAAGMLGSCGRCRTFDVSANGYNKGEGMAAIVMNNAAVSTAEAIQSSLGSVDSTFLNHDGRSASLTAPNGPAQQSCIRGALRQADLDPVDMTITENHGTGTALGDPIEVGSIQSVFRKHHAMCMVTHKSNTSHLEACAGLAGVIRVLLTLGTGSCSGNNHLRELNHHMELERWNGFIPIEVVDTSRPVDGARGGLNGFGFGGSNGRCQFWGRGCHAYQNSSAQPAKLERLRGLTVLCPRCMGGMCWQCGAAVLEPKKHQCMSIRDESASYDYCSNCYDGAYCFGDTPSQGLDLGRKVFLIGTWSAWSVFDAMEDSPGGGYVGRIILGETKSEQFHLALDQDWSRAIFPDASRRASQHARISGPSASNVGAWFIDGHQDGAPEGAVYVVHFTWDERGKAITWRWTGEVAHSPYEHTYSIVGSLTGWQPMTMKWSDEDEATWQVTCRITSRLDEEFYVIRDQDCAQTIFPLEPSPRDASVPVMGPGDASPGHHWAVRGKTGDAVKILLRVSNGDISLTVSTPTTPATIWMSPPGGCLQKYFVRGTWNGGGFDELQVDPLKLDVHRCTFKIGCAGREEFHLIANRSCERALFPVEGLAAPGSVMVLGPANPGHPPANWEVVAPPGQLMELILDLSAEDNRQMVTCHRRSAWSKWKTLPS